MKIQDREHEVEEMNDEKIKKIKQKLEMMKKMKMKIFPYKTDGSTTENRTKRKHIFAIRSTNIYYKIG